MAKNVALPGQEAPPLVEDDSLSWQKNFAIKVLPSNGDRSLSDVNVFILFYQQKNMSGTTTTSDHSWQFSLNKRMAIFIILSHEEYGLGVLGRTRWLL